MFSLKVFVFLLPKPKKKQLWGGAFALQLLALKSGVQYRPLQFSTEAGRGLKALGGEPWSRFLAWVRLGRRWAGPPHKARGPLLGTGAAPLR